ncbi:MAG: acyltransferase [Bacteroidota bacterium]
MNKAYLPNLTALRGIAAILVATLHFHFFLAAIVPYAHAGLMDKLYLMVDLFFILSGFIMCHVYEDSFTQGIKGRKYRNFLLARLARIYPLHVLALVAEIGICCFFIATEKFDLLSVPNQHLYRFDAIPIQLVFLQTVGIYNFDTWNAPAWSLSAEWWAYVLFPFLFIAFRKLGYKKWFVGSLMAIGSWIAIEFLLAPLEPFMDNPPNPNHKTLDVNWHYGTLRGITGFIAGMSVWQLFTREVGRSFLGNGWTCAAIAMLSLVSMQIKWIDTLTVVLFACLILSSAYGSPMIDRIYAWKPFVKLGQWSFSIYMWHMILIHIIIACFMMERSEPVKGLLRPLNHGTFFEKWLWFLGFLVLTSAIGYLSFRFIENPVRKAIRARIPQDTAS